MNYVLEADNEFDRLEKQSMRSGYDFKKELVYANLNFENCGCILDAGSGSGIVSRWLAESHPHTQVIGCDISDDRVSKANKVSQKYKNLAFKKENLESLSFADNSLDVIVCRYVIQHIQNREGVIQEFFRCLRPGGTVCMIDFDGSYYNIFPRTKCVHEVIELMERECPVDLRIGRKLPHLLLKNGFEECEWAIETTEVSNGNIEDEKYAMEERLINLKKFFIDFLGSEEKYNRFMREYLSLFNQEGLVYFYNKFIVTAKKPESNLKLVP